MECRMKIAPKYKIHVHLLSDVPDLSLYTRLHFGLNTSSWFPRPLGIHLWSALHVVLILQELTLVIVRTFNIFTVQLLGNLYLSNFIFPALVIILGVFLLRFSFVVVKSVFVVPLSKLIRFSWSLMCENSRLLRVRGECRGWWADA